MAQKRVGVFVAIAVIILIFLPSFVKLQQLRYRDRILKEKIKTLEKNNNVLFTEKNRLENDSFYLEEVARQEMGVTRKGEIIYKIVPQQEQRKVK